LEIKKQSASHRFRQLFLLKFNGIVFHLKSTEMKTQLKTILVLLLGASIFILMGCKKERHDLPVTIVQTSTTVNEENGYTETGTFTATGGIETTGTFVMDVTFVADSFYCVKI